MSDFDADVIKAETRVYQDEKKIEALKK